MSSMAKQGMQRTGASFPPLPAAYGRLETNPYLRSRKASVVKTLNFQARSVFCQRDLAVCLIAVGRIRDAIQVLHYAHQNVRFRGSFGVWYAAATACSVALFIYRKSKQHGREERYFRRFVDPPAHAILTQPDVWTATMVRREIARERERFDRGCHHIDAKLGIEEMAWRIASVIFLREMAFGGYIRRGRLNLGLVDRWIEKSLAQLSSRVKGISKTFETESRARRARFKWALEQSVVDGYVRYMLVQKPIWKGERRACKK
jgi:hypothetical protein